MVAITANPRQQSPLGRRVPRPLQFKVEAVLRDVAFALHLTRSLKEALLEEKARKEQPWA